MANEEHVERLKRSVDGWNKWRQEQPEIRPDLSSADLNHANFGRAKPVNLSYTDLSGANLSDTILVNVDFRNANLINATLHNAILMGANLSGASLRNTILVGVNFATAKLGGADLSGALLNSANLIGANLIDTNFSGADLSFVNLNGADLNNADLTSVIFASTIFIQIDLNNVKGIQTAIHEGPSTVNINSVILPHDEPTRLHFLRGVGFTETQIEYLPSLLVPQPIEYYSLFISYASQDDTIAKRLYTDLRKKDVPCWFALHDLRPGTPILRGIEEAIHLQDKFLLILSKNAMSSAWIEREVDAAFYQEIKRGKCCLNQ